MPLDRGVTWTQMAGCEIFFDDLGALGRSCREKKRKQVKSKCATQSQVCEA